MVKAGRPPESLIFDPKTDAKFFSMSLWRIFRAAGDHPTAWNQLRMFGPVRGMRFDPHSPPPDLHDRGVLYAATDLTTAFAEVFQKERVISGDRGATFAGWVPTRPLVLLDLTGNWLIRNGAGTALTMGPKRFTQDWAHTIDDQLGDQIDGLYHRSALTGQPLVTLFQNAERSLPARPGMHRLVNDPLAQRVVARVATEIGYGVRGR